jgi:hypothetical protein
MKRFLFQRHAGGGRTVTEWRRLAGVMCVGGVTAAVAALAPRGAFAYAVTTDSINESDASASGVSVVFRGTFNIGHILAGGLYCSLPDGSPDCVDAPVFQTTSSGPSQTFGTRTPRSIGPSPPTEASSPPASAIIWAGRRGTDPMCRRCRSRLHSGQTTVRTRFREAPP